MANNKQRYINTRLWNDAYVAELDPVEKLLFIYLLSNEHTNISGIYEVPLKIIGIETGIDKTMLEKILPRLQDKIRYIDGFVVIKNHLKHQELDSPNIIKGIQNCLQELNKEWLEKIIEAGYYNPLHTPYIPLGKPLDYSNSNSNLKKSSETSSPSPLKLEKTREYLKSIPEQDLTSFYSRFDCSKQAIKSKAEDLLNWCEVNGKHKKNYKAFLLVALKKDFPERKTPVAPMRRTVIRDGKAYMVEE